MQQAIAQDSSLVVCAGIIEEEGLSSIPIPNRVLVALPTLCCCCYCCCAAAAGCGCGGQKVLRASVTSSTFRHTFNKLFPGPPGISWILFEIPARAERHTTASRQQQQRGREEGRCRAKAKALCHHYLPATSSSRSSSTVPEQRRKILLGTQSSCHDVYLNKLLVWFLNYEFSASYEFVFVGVKSSEAIKSK